jgi:sec-independent protein translocase protein TatB
MFNIGFGELAVICIVLIIAVGPDRLPSMMKSLGKTIRTLRQASRDIRASTGIDELMREDFDLYAPIRPAPQPRRLAPVPAPEPELVAADVLVPSTPASNVETEPTPVSREDVVEEVTGDRPSVVVAPAPQTVGLPPESLPEAIAPEVLTGAAPPQPAAAAPVDPPLPAADNPITSNVDTLPRAAIIPNPTPPATSETKPEAAREAGNAASAPSEPKPSGA